MVAIHLAEYSDMFGWDNAFRILGSPRCQPLLAELGVPAGMARAPRALLRIARRYWLARWRPRTWLPPGPWDPSVEQLVLRHYLAILGRAFADLAAAYGEAEAAELYSWARRHLAGEEQRARLRRWTFLLLPLTKEQEPMMPPLAPERSRWVAQVVQAHMGREASDWDHERIGEALARPPSSFERRMLALEPVVGSTRNEVNLSALLSVLQRHHRVLEIWHALDEGLTVSEREDLLWWAQDQRPGDDIAPP
jgi:hypothetical protein